LTAIKESMLSWSYSDIVIYMQRFFPSEFGNDVDQTHAVDEGMSYLNEKLNFVKPLRLKEFGGMGKAIHGKQEKASACVG